MADDLIAELTLRLRNEMASGQEEIRAEFSALGDVLTGLTGVLGELTAALASLSAPVALTEGMAVVTTETDNAIKAVQELGGAIDADAAKLTALKEMYSGGAGGGSAFVPPEVSGQYADQPAFIPPGMTPPEPAPGGGVEDAAASAVVGGEAAGYHAKMMHHTGMDLVMGAVAVAVSHQAAEDYANFSSPALHSAITEKLSGAAAFKEMERIENLTDSLALKYDSSSMDLANAYLFLVTTGMSKNLIDQMMPSMAEASTAYNVPVSDMSQAVFSLNENLKIPADEMTQGLGILAYAAKLGHYNLAAFGHGLPVIGGQMSLVGMTGTQGEVEGASDLEVIRRNTGSSDQATTELEDLMVYLHSMMALRMFDKTKRMEDLLGPSGQKILDKYHLKPMDLPDYLNEERAKGVDEVDAITDYFHKILAPIQSPTDRGIVVGAYFHNLGAQNAILALNQYYDVLHQDQQTLSGVQAQTVNTDFQTASQAPQAQMQLYNEQLTQLTRELGRDVLPSLVLLGQGFDALLQAVNAVGDFYSHHIAAPLGGAIGTAAAYTQHYFDELFPGTYSGPIVHPERGGPLPPPIHLTVNVDKSGNVTAHSAPGRRVNVNQGAVVGVH